MASITNLSVRRPVATVMVYLILIVVGLVSFRSLPVDLLPKIEYTTLTVRMGYPNVGPEEIEQILTNRIENAVSGLPNLERIFSRSEEGRAWVRLQFARGTNVDEAANDLRAALDGIRDDFPIEAGQPEILKLDLDNFEVVGLVATSNRHLEELTRLLERELAQRFKQLPGVGAVELRGAIYREIHIDLERDRLKASGLTAIDVQNAIRQENVTLPGGNVKEGLSDLYVRASGEYRNLEEIRRTVVTTVNGAPIRIEDISDVRDGHQDIWYLAEVNGVPSVSLSINKQSGANTVQVAELIRREAERINQERDDVHLTVFSDQSEFINQSIATVRSSALWGSFLAIFILYLFLRNRASTAIIAVSIPISVIASFGLLYFGGLTLNQMTFGGLALGVGLIVDNAIVVLESIVRKRDEGHGAIDAAELGTRDVAGAVTASTLTTCVIFLPVVFVQSTSGALFQALALVVVFALACSLLVALTLVPMLAGRLLRQPPQVVAGGLRRGPMVRLENWYIKRIRWAIDHRAWVYGTTAVLLTGAVLLWTKIPVELAPQTDADELDVELEMAEGTDISVMRRYVDELETLVRGALPPGQIDMISTEVRGGNAEVEVRLLPQHKRSLTSVEIADQVRAAVEGKVPGAEIEVQAHSGLWILRRIFRSGQGNEEIELELRGWDIDKADQLAAQIRERLQRIAGLTDVRVRRREGRPEERLIFDRDRISELGLSVQDVARTIQANVGGVEAGRLRDGGDEYPILVRLKPEDRLTGQDLSQISLRTPSGVVVPLSTVVTRQRGRGPTNIFRVDGQRVTYITAGLKSGVAQGDAMDAIREELGRIPLPEGYSIMFGGEYEEQQQARKDFLIAIAMALLLVYMLMAAQFERLIDPAVVMLAVPTALVGVVPALLLTGTTLNIQSVMGLVMLIGIVVNNAIVLVDTVNLLRREKGLDIEAAVIESGRLRLRPILMTTSTTVLGLLPLALGWGIGGEIQASLARVVIGGLLASTLVTLFLIPVTLRTATRALSRGRGERRLTPAAAAHERLTAERAPGEAVPTGAFRVVDT